MGDYSKYQQKVIKSFYDNRESIAVQRLQELVTELYLATGKQRRQALEERGAAPGETRRGEERVDRLLEKDDAAELAKLVQQLAAKSSSRRRWAILAHDRMLRGERRQLDDGDRVLRAREQSPGLSTSVLPSRCSFALWVWP